MYESDREIMDKIQKEMEDVQVPESLKPEHIEAMLREHEEQEKKVTKIRKRKNIYRIGSLAAACLVLVSGVWVFQNGKYHKAKDEQAAAVEETVQSDVADSKSDNKNSEEKTAEAKEGGLDTAGSYDEIYTYVENYENQYMTADEEDGGGFKEKISSILNGKSKGEINTETVAEASSDAAAKTTGQNSSADYSSTNTREENVDEGDVVKTDGRYLYILKENSKEIAIADTKFENQGLKMITRVRPEKISSIEEIYITDNGEKMILVGNYQEEADNEKETEVKDVEAKGGMLYPGNRYSNYAVVITYDVKDHTNPKEIGRVTQSGYYRDSRLMDGYVYLFSNFNIPFGYTELNHPDTYVPKVNGKVMEYADICVPPYQIANSYLVITSVDLKKPAKLCKSKAILSDYGQLYVSEKNIYYYETEYSDDENVGQKTIIRSIGYEKGTFTNGHKAKVDGYIDDSFSIDEYDGYLRVITTVDDLKNDTTTNEVNVLDSRLNVVGRLKDLAEGEVVYSARLMGKTGYFVTFRQTDPLFSVDFSDPKNPKIIGSLKIPGFSEYLHPWGDGRLLGIGMDADEETGAANGMKLTMFDISDPSNVKEEATYLLENYYYSEVLYSYKSALASEPRNLIGFAADNNEGTNYLLFEYNEKTGFKMNLEEEVNGNGWFGTRGVYIDKTLYVIRGNVIEAYDLKSYEKTDDLIL